MSQCKNPTSFLEYNYRIKTHQSKQVLSFTVDHKDELHNFSRPVCNLHTSYLNLETDKNKNKLRIR